MQTRLVVIAITLKVLAIGVFSTTPCSGQGLKTVAECRAHRDAWYASLDKDTKLLHVKELIRRADEMTECVKEIDNKFFHVKQDNRVLDETIADFKYAVLASTYNREAFNRALWYLQSKGLANDLIIADKKGEIQQPDSVNEKK